MAEPLKSLEKLKDACSPSPRNKLVREWKDSGKKVLGWMCTYVPEEIIHASGMLPFRVYGGVKDIKEADAYLHTNTCSYVRSCFEMALQNDYDFLDGFVACASCDPMRRCFDNWNHYFKKPLNFILAPSAKNTPEAIELYAKEIGRFLKNIEETQGVEVNKDSLRRSIGLYNKTRKLLREIYAVKKEDGLPVSGTETLEIVRHAARIPREAYNALLEEIVEEIKSRPKMQNGNIRILVSGSEIDQPDFIQLIEDQGATVVMDDLCTGNRYFWDDVDESVEPIEALAARYLNKPPCARVIPWEDRADYLKGLVKDFKVDAVILESLKFCPPFGFSKPLTMGNLEAAGIPVLELEREHGDASIGQLKTRIEAFLEMLRR
jgi:bzd-type benzoyl-CoA reductase N subunit